jgi:hypothetical protein
MKAISHYVLLIVGLSTIITQLLYGLRICIQYDPRNMDADTSTNKTLIRSVSAETYIDDHKDELSRHFLAQNSTVLPAWFKEYVVSHKEKRLALNETNWKNQRFLIMRCLETDTGPWQLVCGGASDRLQSVPAMLMLANMTGRMLFIKWSRPAPLQEFLVPPTGGLDWTIPDWLDLHLDFQKLPVVFKTRTTKIAMKEAASSKQIMTFRRQMHTNGATFYNEHKSMNELEFNLVVRAFWDTLFTPSPPVAALIRQNMNDLHLVPGAYVSAHVRTLYMRDTSNDMNMIRNAVNCATKLKPGLPVYFASDSSKATLAALQYGRSKENANVTATANATATVVARIADTEPMHLDRGSDYLHESAVSTNVSASAYYDTFVDLYLLAGSQCLSYGRGGYGEWGALLSHNSTCSSHHPGRKCAWTDYRPVV